MPRYSDTKEIPVDEEFPEYTEAFPDIPEEYLQEDYSPGDEAYYEEDSYDEENYEAASYEGEYFEDEAYEGAAYDDGYYEAPPVRRAAPKRASRPRQSSRGRSRAGSRSAQGRNAQSRNAQSRNAQSRNAQSRNAQSRSLREQLEPEDESPVRKKRANNDVLRRFGQRLIAIAVAIILIAAVVLIAFGGRIKESIANHEEFGGRWLLSLLYPEKYSYGTERADMKDYFQLFSDDDVAIILQDERIASHAKYIDNTVYFSLDTVRDLFTRRFYVNEDEGVLLYTTSDQVIKNVIGENTYIRDGESHAMGSTIARFSKDGTFYISADYVRLFSDFDYSFYTDDAHSNRVQVYTSWEDERIATVENDTMLRLKGGIKSDVLREINAGEEVKVLDVMETWSKVKTSDAFIGFVENRTLSEAVVRSPRPATGAYNPLNDYPMAPDMERVIMGWQQIFETDSGGGMEELTAAAAGLNVVSPTWYFLQNEAGDYMGIPSHNYVDRAHAKGYKVWPLIENVDYEFDEEALFSSSERRAALIEKLINGAAEYGVDGINMDIELKDAELAKTGSHYVQFLRELSIACHRQGIALSVDVPPPTESNKPWDYEELGLVCDYVVLMAYDEHYSGSDAGSVASLDYVETALDNVTEKYNVPAAKIICAMPFYTRLWLTEGSSVSSEAIGMRTAREWVDNRGIEPLWQDDAGQYYAEYRDGTALYQLWMEEERSITAKVSLMNEKGVHSTAGWKLGLEAAGIWDSINNTLQ